MKKIIYGALFGLILVIVILSVGANTNGAPVLTYVYSNSMEPLIKVNDAFLVWPSSDYEVGDIVMYRPHVLEAHYITHRIIAVGNNGYITKGDNSPYKDQDSGEPEVLSDSIVGKVVCINGQPLILPGLGNLSSTLKIDKYSKYLSGIFLILAIITLLTGNKRNIRKRKSKHRIRLRQVYNGALVLSMFIVILSIYLGSQVTQIQYLVSEYPGNLGDQIEVNKSGKLVMQVKNSGFIPVWPVVKGIDPISFSDGPQFLGPLSTKTLLLDVVPQHQTGLYQGYVQVYYYPILMPKTWVEFLHEINPFLAIMAEGLAIGILSWLFFTVISNIHGFEKWVPLRAFKDKITNRRLNRAKAKLIGRRRTR